jgi:polyisoprenoid-binding protein YceI
MGEMVMSGRAWIRVAGVVAMGLVAGCGEDPSVNKPMAKTGPAVATAAPAGSNGAAPVGSNGAPTETPIAAGTPAVAGAAVAESNGAAPVEAAEPTAPAAGATMVAFSGANGSTIKFVGSKKIGGAHDGGFKAFTGTFVLPAAPEAPTLEKVVADIDMNSIWSDDEKLTAHLKNQDFFEVDKYPTARFETTSITSGGENGATHTLTGNLTLHGVTKSIVIPATVTISDGEVALKSEFVLNKEEFGMTFAGPGGVIRHEVVVKLDVKGAREG